MSRQQNLPGNKAPYLCFGDAVYLTVYIKSANTAFVTEQANKDASDVVQGHLCRLSSDLCGVKTDSTICKCRIIVFVCCLCDT